jgi:hypothetical protein
VRVIPPIEQLELDLTAARARIAELERWQKKARRALREYRARCVCCVADRCPTCSTAEKLIQEATQ